MGSPTAKVTVTLLPECDTSQAKVQKGSGSICRSVKFNAQTVCSYWECSALICQVDIAQALGVHMYLAYLSVHNGIGYMFLCD